MGNSMEAPHKLNIQLPYDPAIPLLGIHLKKCELGYNKGTCTPMFTAALFIIAKPWKQPRCQILYYTRRDARCWWLMSIILVT
jgi:hypothetical protein